MHRGLRVPLDAGRDGSPASKVEENPMPEPDKNNQAYERAHKRVVTLRDFYMHFMWYLVVNLGLFAIDMATPGGPWFYWPLIGWGIVVMMHGFSVLMEGSFFSERWEERKTRQLMERDRERTGGPPRPPRPLAP
ncbi:MAG TPA: 2TM domain-containing protein [Archangium sp.]|uniref:2TM domain-containing protein n=1 Tax=Archangium sp. TaxID=1872627 RepID=UPI002E371156|nr:2TM domain-containing protein [Archangium sp.]HEX5749555.1 2TM domain-containing protein [Archangium sp.]